MPSPDTPHTALASLRSANRLNAFKHAFAGIVLLVKTQPNARIHLLASLAVVALGWWLQVPAQHWAMLTLAMGGVWTAEALNTAVETVVNLVSPQWHALARDAKDLAAAAVLLATLAAVATGLLIFGPALAARWG